MGFAGQPRIPLPIKRELRRGTITLGQPTFCFSSPSPISVPAAVNQTLPSIAHCLPSSSGFPIEPCIEHSKRRPCPVLVCAYLLTYLEPKATTLEALVRSINALSTSRKTTPPDLASPKWALWQFARACNLDLVVDAVALG